MFSVKRTSGHRRLEAIIKMQKDLEGKLYELMQQMKCLGGRNSVQRELNSCRYL